MTKYFKLSFKFSKSSCLQFTDLFSLIVLRFLNLGRIDQNCITNYDRPDRLYCYISNFVLVNNNYNINIKIYNSGNNRVLFQKKFVDTPKECNIC